MMSKVRTMAASALATFAVATPALAHHALGGRQPIDFGEGFFSGLAHPIINFDHFAFIVAVGVFAAVTQASKLQPAWFVGGTILGCLLMLNGVVIPFNGWLVHAAVLALGLALALGKRRMRFLDTGAFLLAGLLHGSLYAQAIVGSVSVSIGGYLLGFAIIQTIVATGAMFAAYMLWRGDQLYANARVVGGVVAGVGLTVMAQAGVAAMFPSL
ncbi:HupE/UreJ family protein [Pelagibacterium halotolerans]|uniref:HupE/UreJ family protein n=1 Tax=Pelagibacterium halotolerans (strain DSM 22347 / JCM 15775 / CGMCC 1.7692 / B2) TaxID=1082931 RepID=G4R718_PELHB|nr:HupE/UreJ family protein [Pelagibacterium halotolerans]AEQ50172.1 HupE/UreJ family protein [Pelagibacterium halotolerans B2]QJR19820.1 hypothetical protein HKM20_16105 [Pelagibacterium halotolerans]